MTLLGTQSRSESHQHKIGRLRKARNLQPIANTEFTGFLILRTDKSTPQDLHAHNGVHFRKLQKIENNDFSSTIHVTAMIYNYDIRSLFLKSEQNVATLYYLLSDTASVHHTNTISNRDSRYLEPFFSCRTPQPHTTTTPFFLFREERLVWRANSPQVVKRLIA